MSVQIRPVTPSRWDDLERLFGPNGAYANCWCMWWRMPSKEFDGPGTAKRSGLKRLVDAGRVPGLLAYRGGEPVGWVSISPREEFGRLERSPKLKRVDDRPVWSVVCFYIPRGERGGGLGKALLKGALDHVASRGGGIVEAYPIDTNGRRPSAEVFTGVASMFERAGFREVERRGGRPIMRKRVRRRR
jgi:GNAT superfamily N-acetyltransferase